MPSNKPSWFPTDNVFESKGGWYVGSPNGLSIGPYQSMAIAKAHAAQAKAKLAGARDVGEMLRIVRDLATPREEKAAQHPAQPQMIPRRAGEHPQVRYRSERFICLEGKWYFMSREGIDVGPYDTKEAAQHDARSLVKLLRRCTTKEEACLTIHEFMRRPVLGRSAIHRASG